MTAHHQIDGLVLAAYGIIRNAITAEAHLGGNYGVLRAFDGRFDRQLIVVSTTPIAELDEDEKLDLLELACELCGMNQPACDAASLKFRKRYIKMMERTNGRTGQQPNRELEQPERDRATAKFVELYLTMMNRTNARRQPKPIQLKPVQPVAADDLCDSDEPLSPGAFKELYIASMQRRNGVHAH